MNKNGQNEYLSDSKKEIADSKNECKDDIQTDKNAEKTGARKKWYSYGRRRHMSETGPANDRQDQRVDKDLGAIPKKFSSQTFHSKKYERRGSLGSKLQRGISKEEKDGTKGVMIDHVERKEQKTGSHGAKVYSKKESFDKQQKNLLEKSLEHNMPKHSQTITKIRNNASNNTAKTNMGRNKSVNTEYQEQVHVIDANKAKGEKKKFSKKRKTNENMRMVPGHKNHSKETHLYVVIRGKINNQSKLKDFILHRMGNPKALDFEVTDSCDVKKVGSEGSVITLKFESYNKASCARYLLTRNNRTAEDRIRCFFEKVEAEGVEVDTTQKNQSKKEIALKEIISLAADVLERHDGKIDDIRINLSDVARRLSNKRGVSLLEYDKLSNEKLAYEDKLEELEMQRKEFTRYVQSMKVKLETLIKSNKFEKELKDVRRAFGVECHKLQSALPMYARREEILSIIKENQVCVILGETGSGKSTQMVQYLYQAGFAEDGLIACTQPRKIAAVSLASHVASELASSVGQVIGYKVGMQSKTTSLTKVLFMTDHILLNECLHDRMLAKYSCILIDEAHERSIHTDLLLGMIKDALNNRPDLKVVITSATIDPDIFVEYFGGIDLCPILRVSGRTFPVEVFWEQDDDFDGSFPEDYEGKALNKAIELHQTEGEGDILVFLTSAAETDRCKERLIKMVGDKDVQCLQLHGKLNPEEQQLVFANTPRRKRKIVFATNSAETSITIPGIKFVVDTGVVKEMRFDPKKNMNSLDVVSVSQSSADQRKGRAGRTSSGVCYRLYTEKTYNSFKKASSPEILRIQVSQAMLKLMELGVDPMSFDYVQSPSTLAMKSALTELEEIGAIKNREISQLGRWVAKLPIEPRLAAFIKKGIDRDIALETLIVASCCNQSGIFFRMGTPEEKKEADGKKIKFCHLGGDLLTMLNVYREWDNVNERGKGKWCQTNSINGKAMKGVRDMMNEMVMILKKELDVKIKHEFKPPKDSDFGVQILIFECMTSKLGYYLGHESAGYLIVSRQQRVQLHPSSAILSLAFQPSWVVFNRVLKTSADYMTEVTPVPDDIVKDAIKNDKISVNISLLESLKVKKVLKAPVGKHVFWKFVGPMHQNRRKVEEDISFACNGSLVVIDANKQRGEISLFCTNEYATQASSMLQSILDAAPKQLLNESREEPIGQENCFIRAVLREGGSVVDILMSDDYRAANIKQKDNVMFDINEESIQTLLEEYGTVEQIWQTTGKRQQQSPFWGKVTFTHKQDARNAVEEINEDENCEFRLIPITYNSHISAPKQGFTMKLTWCRRPGRGFCYVYLDRPEDMTQLLTNATRIKGNYVHVLISKQKSDLYIKGLSCDVNEDEVKDGLGSTLGLSSDECRNRFRIIIPRVNVPIGSNERDQIQNELSSVLSMYADRDSFRLHVREYKPQSVMCVAFVTFMNPQLCYNTADAMIDDNVKIRERSINVQLECKTSVHVNKKLHDFVRQDLNSLVERYVHKKSSTTLNIRHLKSGNFSVDINAVSLQKLAKAKINVENIVGGDTLECGETENLQFFFNKNGREEARRIEKLTKTLIFIDERQMKLSIQGLVHNRLRAIQMIEDYLSVNRRAKEKEVCLKGEENPPGLLKALIIKYGLRLAILKEETGISKVLFNLRFHELTLIGTEENINKAEEQIKNVRAELSAREQVQVKEPDFPVCPICLCPVEESDMCRLEYCGHAYCKCCLASMVQNAVSDRQLPVVCAAENCNKPLVIRDINTQIKIGNIKRNALLDAALAAFVMKNSEEYHFCISADCGVVYRVTKSGEIFSCPVCRTKICTACHSQSHEGLTCAMYKSAKKDGASLMKWLKMDPGNRKLCPKCGFGIEKTGGCEHMECKCGAHICWKCLRYFSSSGSCYGHLRDAHNSFV